MKRRSPPATSLVGSGDRDLRGLLGRVAEDELKQAVEGVAFPPLMAWDENGKVLLANKAAGKALGLRLDQLVGMDLVDIAGPESEVNHTLADFRQGRFAAVHTHRSIHTSDGKDVPVFATSRAVEVDGQMAGLSAFVSENETGRLGRNPLRTWLDLVPVAVGCTDVNWNVLMVSTEIKELIDRTPAEVTGQSFLGLIDPRDVDLVLGSSGAPEEPRSLPQVRFLLPTGEDVEICMLLAPRTDPKPGTRFAMVGRIESYFPQQVDRVADLELRLRRIGAEVRAAGLIEAALPVLQSHPELNALSTRQWEILSRLLAGERVPTIASELYISPSTVRNHLSMIFQRFGVHSQAELLEKLRQPTND